MKIFDVYLFETTTSELVKSLLDDLKHKNKKLLAFANVNTLNISYEDMSYSKILKNFLVVNDGVGVDIAAKILYRKTFKENLNGTDFMPIFLASLPEHTNIFIYGSIEKNIKLVENKIINQFKNINVVGVQNGYITDNGKLVSMINESMADIVIVGLGNPKQEFWIMDNYIDVHASIFIGVGAFFDFYSGEVNRSPLWVRKIRMEWLFRLFLEPKRLWKRYLYGNIIFLLRIITNHNFKYKPF